MGLCEMNGHLAIVNTAYLSAAIETSGASGAPEQSEIHRDQLLRVLSNPLASPDSKVGESRYTVTDCLAALMASGDADDLELVMNCAMGRGEMATCARSLLAQAFVNAANASGDIDVGQAKQVRAMAQNAIQLYPNLDLSSMRKPFELLAMAGTVFPGESGADVVPLHVTAAIHACDQSEWRPAWWVAMPPNAGGLFGTATLGQIKQGFEGIPESVKKVKVQGDGSCMFRSCLALHLAEERWVTSAISKDALFDQLVELGWDALILAAIQTAYNDLSEFMPPSEAVVRAFSAEAVFDQTIGNREFSLYSPQGIGRIMEGVTSFSAAEDHVFFEMLADTIAQRFIEFVGADLAPADCSVPDAFADGGGWLVPANVHYDLLVTDGFFADVHASDLLHNERY